MPDVNKALTDATQAMKLIQTLVGIAFPLGGQIVGIIRVLQDSTGVDQKTREEAQAAVDTFNASIADAKQDLKSKIAERTT